MQAEYPLNQQGTDSHRCSFFPLSSGLLLNNDNNNNNNNNGGSLNSGSKFSFFRRPGHQLENEETYSSTQQTASSLPPSHDPSPESADALLARELNRMSIQEREKIFEEIHGVDGVDDGNEEDPKFLSQCVEQMEEELRKLNRKSAYLQAKIQNRGYVSKRDLLLKFLRSETYKPKEAAIRLVAFFELKLELFGKEKLTKEIRAEDFTKNPDDMAALESGLFHCLPGRDRSGRIILGKFHRPEFSHIPLESKMRMCWYMLMTVTEEERDQRQGVVLLVFNMDGIVNRVETWKNSTLLATIPVRVNAFHMCYNDPKITVLTSLAMLAMGPYYRARFRMHEGTIIECIYMLLTFGIPSHLLPISAKGDELDLTDLKEWIQKRKQVEDKRTPLEYKKGYPQIITEPSRCDVLFGRGKSSQNNPGNIRYRQMIDESRSAYEKAKLLEKTLIAERIIKDVKTFSGRFLKHGGDGGWVEVDDDTARDKISHAFRDKRRKLKQQLP